MKKYIYSIILSAIFFSCFSNKDELIGKKRIVGNENLFVRIYQEDEFDSVTAVLYDIIDDKDSIIKPMTFLFGTSDKLTNIEGLDAFVHDDIFYLCRPYPNIVKIKNLSKKDTLSKKDLFKKIKEFDDKLLNKNFK